MYSPARHGCDPGQTRYTNYNNLHVFLIKFGYMYIEIIASIVEVLPA
jgi:hypothetical protein